MYHPRPSNIVLIVRLDNVEAEKVVVARHGSRLCMSARYLGGYIGDDESKRDWFIEHTLT